MMHFRSNKWQVSTTRRNREQFGYKWFKTHLHASVNNRFRQWLVAYSPPSHDLNQCWVLSIGPLRTNFSGIWTEIQHFSFTKMHLQTSSAKWRPFYPREDELIAKQWQLRDLMVYNVTTLTLQHTKGVPSGSYTSIGSDEIETLVSLVPLSP